MLRSIDELLGYVLAAEDGEIGRCKDFLFDDRHWTIRYMVADTGKWLPGRKVLISPISLGEPDWTARKFPVKMTKGQVENSPPLEEDMPVSREYETRYFNYYGYPYYWAGAGLWGSAAYPGALYGVPQADVREERVEKKRPNHLRSAKEVEGYRIDANDGHIGHVEDYIVEEETWTIRYVIVDTRNWLPGGKKVLISPDWTSAIQWQKKELVVDLTKDAIKNAPEYDPSVPINREYEVRLYDFYGRPRYWT